MFSTKRPRTARTGDYTDCRRRKNAFSFYLPRQFSNHSGILRVLPSQSLARPGEHVTSECFRSLIGSLRWLSPGAKTAARLLLTCARDCPPPFPDSANRRPPLLRDQWGGAKRARWVTQEERRRDVKRGHVGQRGVAAGTGLGRRPRGRPPPRGMGLPAA